MRWTARKRDYSVLVREVGHGHASSVAELRVEYAPNAPRVCSRSARAGESGGGQLGTGAGGTATGASDAPSAPTAEVVANGCPAPRRSSRRSSRVPRANSPATVVGDVDAPRAPNRLWTAVLGSSGVDACANTGS